MDNDSYEEQTPSTSRMKASPRILLAGWIGSMVLVALLTVLVTSQVAEEPAPAVSDTASDDAVPSSADTGMQSDRQPPVASSPDTQIEGPSRSNNESAPQAASRDEGDASPDIMPSLELVGRQGLTRLADVDMPPSEGVSQWCDELAARVAGVDTSDCMTGAFVESGHQSVNGRPLIVRDIEADEASAAGRVLLIAATHGDEISSVGAVFGWLNIIADEGTPYEWRVAPVVNPDGLFHEPPTRVNANGVDLNRNLPTTGWEQESRDYWRRVGFEKRRFPGESPGSEPENQWLAELIEEFQPGVIISMHAPYGVLDYDGDFPAPRQLGNLNLHRLGVYPGSLGNYASRMQGIPVITVELEDADERPSDTEVQRMWADLNDWLDRYFRSVRQASADSGGAEAG